MIMCLGLNGNWQCTTTTTALIVGLFNLFITILAVVFVLIIVWDISSHSSGFDVATSDRESNHYFKSLYGGEHV